MTSTAPDINDLSLLNEPVEGLDPNARSEDFFKVSLPDDGDHLCVMTLGNDGVTHDRQRDKSSADKTGSVYIKAHVALKIQDPSDPADGMMLFDRLTSIVFSSKGTSALHAVMDVAGFPLGAQLTKGEIIEAVKVALAQSPRVKVTSQWEAQVEDQTKIKGSKDRYRTVVKGQARMPKVLDDAGNETGHYAQEVHEPGTGLLATAQARVIRYAKA